MNDFLFPDARQVLEEAAARHSRVLPFALEAIDLAHLAHNRQRHYAAQFVPGVPSTRRVRNDINDDAWRYLQLIADPLVLDRSIRTFVNIEGGNFMVMPDGLAMRLKKADAGGGTSNYPTPKVGRMEAAAARQLFSGATALDVAIQDGVVFDVVYVAGRALGEYSYCALRFAAVEFSPLLTLDPPTPDRLKLISPEAFDIAADARAKLAS